MKKLIFSFLIFFALICKANNIQVTGVSVVTASNTIRFNVSWDNSWRSTVLNNWDAAWVFLKYYNPVTQNWDQLNFSGTGNVIPAGFNADAGTTSGQNTGYFLYRSASGSGPSTISNIEFGIPAQQATGVYDIKVFAIEMVYVPQGAFYVGDGSSSSTNRFTATALGSPAFINFNSANSVFDPLLPGTLSSLNAGYPIGYNAFYTMKYEVTQGAYRDFLNSLNYNGQANHTFNAPTSAVGTVAIGTGFRNFLEIRTPGVATTVPAVYGCDADADNIYDESNDGEWAVCNFLNWPDQAAYLTWAGLRPLTELEFEKACRGIQLPVANEFAWGNTSIAGFAYTFSNLGLTSESVTNAAASPTGNAVTATTAGTAVLRNGIFATATSNRISSGAGFYGTMELSGNVWERVISTYNGGTFNGTHGSGVLSFQGYSTVGGGWPGFNGGTASIDGTVSAAGLIQRGGGLNSTAASGGLNVSYRGNLITGLETARLQYNGIRGGRTAP